MKQHKNINSGDLTKGSIPKGILSFAIPLFLGQLLQQFYNMVDAWVVGNFADNDAFAAVSSTGTLTFLIIGFFGGIGAGGGVIISRYFGAKDEENVSKAIHTNFLMAIVASILSTAIGLFLTPHILTWMGTPESVMTHALLYLRIYFAGVSTVIMYNVCMNMMRALGDSLHPLYYLLFSSIVNIALDMLFVAHPAFRWGVAGAAIATVIAQGLSVILCIWRMCHIPDYTRLDFRKIRYHAIIMNQVIKQGLPSGVQNAVITVGNLVVQKNINSFGAYAMSGQGAYSKIEGFVFLPITCMSMALPTFISQNLGAREYGRAKKGAAFGIAFGMITAEITGLLIYIFAEDALRIFVDSPEAISYGMIQAHTVSLFFFLLAFSHCAAGVMRGCGRSVVPMVSMLLFWCGVRIIYVTCALKVFPVYQTISWAYPLTWSLSSILFLVFLTKSDWTHYYEKKR
jgi:putative MATE family efflux protein